MAATAKCMTYDSFIVGGVLRQFLMAARNICFITCDVLALNSRRRVADRPDLRHRIAVEIRNPDATLRAGVLQLMKSPKVTEPVKIILQTIIFTNLFCLKLIFFLSNLLVGKESK